VNDLRRPGADRLEHVRVSKPATSKHPGLHPEKTVDFGNSAAFLSGFVDCDVPNRPTTVPVHQKEIEPQSGRTRLDADRAAVASRVDTQPSGEGRTKAVISR